jgi:hypothetical protein
MLPPDNNRERRLVCDGLVWLLPRQERQRLFLFSDCLALCPDDSNGTAVHTRLGVNPALFEGHAGIRMRSVLRLPLTVEEATTDLSLSISTKLQVRGMSIDEAVSAPVLAVGSARGG